MKFKIIGLLSVIALLAYAGSNTLSSVSGGKVQTAHVNQFFNALVQDFLPRNSSGVPTNNGGSIGSSTYKWLKLFVSSGGWVAGDLKMHHTYNGTVTCGQGWMLADGRVIGSSAYDAETGHTAGDWATYVGSSSLNGKYLPNLTSKYPVGVAATTQTGSAAITAVGNASSQINLAHSHTVNSHSHGMNHRHFWLDSSSGEMPVFNSFSTNVSIVNNTTTSTTNGSIAVWAAGVAGNRLNNDIVRYTSVPLLNANSTMPTTDPASPGTDSQLSSPQSIQPHSIEVQYCMRVVD